MFLNAKNDPELAAQFEVIDLDTGKVIEHVLFADDEVGEYGQYNIDNNRNIVLILGEPDITLKRGNIKLRKKNETSPS